MAQEKTNGTPDAPVATPDATEEKTPIRIANLDPVALRIGLSPQRTRNLTKEFDDNGAPLLRTTAVPIPGTDISVIIIPEDAITEYLERRDLPQSDPRAIKTRVSGKTTTSYTVHVPNDQVDAFLAYCGTINAIAKERTSTVKTPDATPVSEANVNAENDRRADALAATPTA